MHELREILPTTARVAKHGRCAEGPCVKTMLADAEPPRRLATVVVIGKLNQGINLRFVCNERANENRYVFAFGA